MVRADTMVALKTWYGQAVEAGLAVMLQEIIPGDDSAVVNYNAYVWDGKPRRRVHRAPAPQGTTARSDRRGSRSASGSREVIEPGRKILAAMEFYGFACTEFKLDRRDGVYKLMEVNGRHNLSGLLAVRCGVNFPLMQYRHLAEGVLPRGGPYRTGIYWTDVVRDVGYSLAYPSVGPARSRRLRGTVRSTSLRRDLRSS